MPDLSPRLLAVQGCFFLHTAVTNAQTVAVSVTVLWFRVKSKNGDFLYIVGLMKMEHRLFF
jgi:hypothetical protein